MRVVAIIAAVVVFFIAAAVAMAQPAFDAMQERDRRYEQRFTDVERSLATAVQNIKEQTASALAAQDKQTNAQFQATKEAVTKAEVATEKRFDSVNEFRNTLKDQQTRFIDKGEVDIRLKAMSDRVEELKNLILANTNRVEAAAARTEGQAQTWGLIAGGLGLLIGFVAAAAGVASFLRRASAGSKAPSS